MVMDDVQFIDALRGRRIKVTLKAASYYGVVQRINSNKTLVLSDVVCVRSGCRFPGSKIFFGSEILNVEFPSEVTGVAAVRGEDREGEDPFTVTDKFQTDTSTEGEDEECVNFVVVDEFHEKFGPAVMHIKKQSVISVGADGIQLFQNGRLCWLQIATKNKVYLFDILLLGARAFKNGLSMILENKDILKVIHDCRAIAGCLIVQYGVKLTNVFDTQVADVMCFYSETGGFLPDRVSTLQEVVSYHLKVPSSQLSSLQVKAQLTKEEKEMWYKRPCPVIVLKVMALSVIHLQPLRLVLLDALLTDYMALVDSYLHSSHCEPDELGHVSMESVSELPRELRQLQQMTHERRERAAKHYSVTEQGLLARFNPQTKSPSQTLPAVEKDSPTHTEIPGPANSESPSSTQQNPPLHQTPTGTPEVSNVFSGDAHTSPAPAAQGTTATTGSDLGKQLLSASPLSAGIGRGCTEALTGTLGRGKSFGKNQASIYSLPAVGRGFLLHMALARAPRDSDRDMKSPGRGQMTPSHPSVMPSQNTSPRPGSSATDWPKDTSGLNGSFPPPAPQSLSSSLRRSFSSFRY